MTEAIGKMHLALEKVSPVSSDEQKRLDLVKKSARLWNEVGQQRFRGFLSMTESVNAPSRSHSKALDQTTEKLELVLVPELRRIGNAHGERLDTDEVVIDCKGKFNRFYAR